MQQTAQSWYADSWGAINDAPTAAVEDAVGILEDLYGAVAGFRDARQRLLDAASAAGIDGAAGGHTHCIAVDGEIVGVEDGAHMATAQLVVRVPQHLAERGIRLDDHALKIDNRHAI